MQMDELAFKRFLSDTISEHPDWLEAAIGALVNGVAESRQKLVKICSEKDRALLCALSLMKDTRVSEGTKEQMNQFIRRGLILDSKNGSELLSKIEKEFLEATKHLEA